MENNKYQNCLMATMENMENGIKNDDIVKCAKKLCEEAIEVMEAAATDNVSCNLKTLHELTQEIMDTMQMCVNMLYFLKANEGDNFNIEFETMEHNRKLIERGWKLEENHLVAILI